MMAGEGLPVQLATRVLAVSESDYYASLTRAPSARSSRHAWLTDQIREVHAVSNRSGLRTRPAAVPTLVVGKRSSTTWGCAVAP
jgi:hypothetical protein